MTDTPALPAKKKRPAALIVISIIGLIYAASSMAGAVQSAIYAPLMSVFGNFMNGMYRSLDYSSRPDYFGVIAGLAPALLLLAAIRLPVNVFGLIACIGALKNKPWTRSGVTAFAVLLFVEAAAAALILILMINPVIDELQQVYGTTFGGKPVACAVRFREQNEARDPRQRDWEKTGKE